MLNPIHHGSNGADIQRYKSGALCDVRGCLTRRLLTRVAEAEPGTPGPPGGCTAPWCGMDLWLPFDGGTTLFMDPRIPRPGREFDLSFRYHSSRYEVKVLNPKGVCRGVLSVEVDGKPVRGGAAIHLTDDGSAHNIHIVLGELPKTS